MNFAIRIPDWNSLDSVRAAHSTLELASIVLFFLLVVCDVLAHFLEENKTKERIFERIGLFCFLLAVVAEIVGYEYGQRNDALSEKKIRSLDALVQDADSTASRAKTTADASNATATRAQGKADAASIIAASVRNRANSIGSQVNEEEGALDTLEKRRAELEKQLTDLAVCNAPRVLPMENPGSRLFDSLRVYAGRRAVIEYMPDAEARRAAFNIGDTLQRSGWVIDKINVHDGLPDGVSVQPYFNSADNALPLRPEESPKRYEDWQSHLRASDAANALIDFLHSWNWQAKWDWPNPAQEQVPRDGIRVSVGLYPAFWYVTPPAAATLDEAAKKAEEARKQRLETAKEAHEKREEEIVKKLPPESALAYKAFLKKDQADAEAFDKLVQERMAGPCQTLSRFAGP